MDSIKSFRSLKRDYDYDHAWCNASMDVLSFV